MIWMQLSPPESEILGLLHVFVKNLNYVVCDKFKLSLPVYK